MKPISVSAAIAAALLSAAAVPCAEGPARITLAEAIARAKAESPRLAELRAREQAAEAGIDGAKSGRVPTVDLSAGYTRYSNVPEYPERVPGAMEPVFLNIPDNWRARVGITAPLYTGGRVEGGIEAASGDREGASRDLEAGEDDLLLETAVAYWSLVTARAIEGVLEGAIGSYDAHLADARNRERLGMAARNEVLAVELERDRAELAALRATNGAAAAEANLARLLGPPPCSRIEPVEPLEIEAPPTADPEALVAAALAARPERAALVARLAAAEARVSVQRSSSRPQVNATAGWEFANPNSRNLPPRPEWNDTWSVGVGLAFTVFDGGRTAAAASQAEAAAIAIRRQIDDLERRIRLDVATRVLDVRTAAASVEVATRSVASAEENRRVSADRYRAGVGLSSDLLDAEVASLRAGLDRTAALADQRLALARLDRAVGR